MYAVISTYFPRQSTTQAFVLFKICQTVAGITNFLLCSILNLPQQLAVLVVVGTVAVLNFTRAEFSHDKKTSWQEDFV